MSSLTDINTLPWEPVRPALTSGVFGRPMLDGPVKMVYTRVEPGGSFAPHTDGYSHLFYVLKGSGIAGAGAEEYPLYPGVVIQVEAGEEHYYRNTGSGDLELISLNLPA